MRKLANRNGLVLGLANEDSIAFGCARAFIADGATVAGAFGHPKSEGHVRPAAEAIGMEGIMYCDVRDDADVHNAIEFVQQRHGKLDFVVHSLAFAPLPDLHDPLLMSSAAGFAEAMDISCHSFVRVARAARAAMKDGGTLLTMSFIGAQRAEPGYALMGPVKAALEATVRYLAAELGEDGIRVHAISPGPIPTRAAKGLADYDELERRALAAAPLKRLATIDDVGALAAFLVSDGAAAMTGGVHFVDGGVHCR